MIAVPVRPVPPPAQLERWLAERAEQRAEFLRRCIAWGALGDGSMVWPRDEVALLELGVPCHHCVTVVHDLAAEPRHSLVVVLVGPGEHWSDGIVAECGGAPAWPA